MTDHNELGLRPTQRPIHFSGVQLPELELSAADLIGEHRGTGYERQPLHERFRTFQDLPQSHTPHERVGPAGESTPEARLLNVSRWSLAARIKHGVPLSELASHFATLVEVEEALR